MTLPFLIPEARQVGAVRNRKQLCYGAGPAIPSQVDIVKRYLRE
jgi:hypothetical protein